MLVEARCTLDDGTRHWLRPVTVGAADAAFQWVGSSPDGDDVLVALENQPGWRGGPVLLGLAAFALDGTELATEPRSARCWLRVLDAPDRFYLLGELWFGENADPEAVSFGTPACGWSTSTHRRRWIRRLRWTRRLRWARRLRSTLRTCPSPRPCAAWTSSQPPVLRPDTRSSRSCCSSPAPVAWRSPGSSPAREAFLPRRDIP